MYPERPQFMNFSVDHMTLLLRPEMYSVYHLVTRIVFGISPDQVVYEKRKEWAPGTGDRSLTFAVNLGEGSKINEDRKMQNTMMAFVQPSEPENMQSHVRKSLGDHHAAVLWQHIALRTSDLLAFHKHAVDRGIRFVTPILKDDEEDLIQIFSGEWYSPGMPSSGMFFEFVQRNPSSTLMQKIDERNREAWFQDKTFLGLYGEKETESRGGKVQPFIDFQLFEELQRQIGNKHFWEITDADIQEAERTMLTYGKKFPNPQPF